MFQAITDKSFKSVLQQACSLWQRHRLADTAICPRPLDNSA